MLPRLLARSWPGLLLQVPSVSSLLKGVYDPRAFIPHAALLRQAFAHCARFPTAASRRSLGRVSVPVWLIVLSDQLPVVALVGRYPTNKLIGRETLPERRSISSIGHATNRGYPVLARVSSGYPGLRGRFLTCYSPVRHSTIGPEGPASFDLHVLGTPPAFVLSQDQTLRRDLAADRSRPFDRVRPTQQLRRATRVDGARLRRAGRRLAATTWMAPPVGHRGGRPGNH